MMNPEIVRWEAELAKSRRLNPIGAEQRIAARVTAYLGSCVLSRPFGMSAEEYNRENQELAGLREWRDAL